MWLGLSLDIYCTFFLPMIEHSIEWCHDEREWCIYWFLVILCSVMSWRARMKYLLIPRGCTYSRWIISDYIILYHISIYNRVELVRLFYSPGLLTVWPVWLDPVFNSCFTHIVCLRRSHWASIILSSFLEIPASTWEACSTASTSRWFLSPPSCLVVMYVLRNGSQLSAVWVRCPCFIAAKPVD
jgi:hypothetical protein